MLRRRIDSPPKITAHYADVGNPDSVNKSIEDILAQHGHIDNLVTSAGFTENFDAINYPHERMQKCWAVNVDGSYLFATGVARHLIERKAPGSIVMIGSMSGAVVNVPQPQAPYNAAKAAIRHLASSFAVEWAPYDIRVNCISPGYMMTALYVPPFFLYPLILVALLTLPAGLARSSTRTQTSRRSGPRSSPPARWATRRISWAPSPSCSVKLLRTSPVLICGLTVVTV